MMMKNVMRKVSCDQDQSIYNIILRFVLITFMQNTECQIILISQNHHQSTFEVSCKIEKKFCCSSRARKQFSGSLQAFSCSFRAAASQNVWQTSYLPTCHPHLRWDR